MELKRLQKPVSWAVIVKALETLRGGKWADLSRRHGDWTRDAALWLGWLHLNELGNLVGGMEYAAVQSDHQASGERVETAAAPARIAEPIVEGLDLARYAFYALVQTKRQSLTDREVHEF